MSSDSSSEIKVAVSTNVRDENNILEWIAFHLAVGFDHVFVVDHLSRTPVSELVNPEILASGKVSVVRYEKQTILGTKFHIVNQLCIPHMQKLKVDWMIHLDGDEYFNPCLPDHRSVKDFLAGFGKHVHQIAVNWLMFGSNFHDAQPEGLVLENFIRCQKQTHTLGKTFFRPDSTIGMTNPHYVKLKRNLKNGTVSAFNRKYYYGHDQLIGLPRVPWQKQPCLINHYHYQSYETYKERQLSRKRDDTGTFKTARSQTEIHGSISNECINEFLKTHFATKTLEVMGQISRFPEHR